MEGHVPGFDYAFVTTSIEPSTSQDGRWASGPSIDGKGEFKVVPAAPGAPRPDLGMPDLKGYAQEQQVMAPDKGIMENIKDTLMP